MNRSKKNRNTIDSVDTLEGNEGAGYHTTGSLSILVSVFLLQVPILPNPNTTTSF